MTLVCEAPAKINLFLAIKGKREDGYHEIETRMLKLDLADRLELTRVDRGISLVCPGSDLPTGPENLVYRAARVFFEAIGAADGVELVLHKRVPVAAGLGGGSSDAAAVLRGLNRLYGFPLKTDQLLALARSLGADVPFFVLDCTVGWATGIGDRIEPEEIDVPPWILLVNPGFSVSTRWVYEDFTLTREGNPYILRCDFAPVGPVGLSRGHVPLHNDLESVTIAKHPELAHLKDELLASGSIGALMSGSGPTVFGLFADSGQAVSCRDRLMGSYGKNVFLARPLGAPGIQAAS